ncbi:transposase [Chromobacterium phragmitis]|uniref:Transposase n=1 Tax=Chromobacterium phragmitis TaxID=2202141 RepID=A0ABV0ITZ9_9NEIS
MKKSKFTEELIVFALHQTKSGTAVAKLCRKRGISKATLCDGKKNSTATASADYAS